MTSSPAHDVDQLIAQIDALIREMEDIRRQVALLSAKQEQSPKMQPSLTDQLFGAMGHGNWEEYESFGDYERFQTWSEH